MDGIIEFIIESGNTIRLKIIHSEPVIYQYFIEEVGKWQRIDENFVNEHWKQYFVINTFVMVEKIKKSDSRLSVKNGNLFFTIE